MINEQNAAAWEELYQAMADYTVLEGVVEEAVKGGVHVFYHGMCIFIPATHTGLSRKERSTVPLEELIGKTVRFVLMEIPEPESGKNPVGSVQVVLRGEKEAAKEEFWKTAEIGREYVGQVKTLTAYGAFVDLGGVDGMVHISELSWSKIKHPSQVVSVGDTIKVYIKDLDWERERISLGYKTEEDNPWRKFLENFYVGQVISVKIVSLVSFGAFAQITEGVDGLIHISQMADYHVEQPKDIVSVGDEVRVMIVDIDEARKRISLSMKNIPEPEQEE